MSAALPNGTIRLRDQRGYKIIKEPDHPLATKGWVPHHRYVLYNQLGPEPQHCTYCGYGPLPWRGNYKHTINVDHINDTPGDDRPENLTASCYWCNLFKSAWHVAFDEHQQAITEHGTTHPAQRPYITRVLEHAWGIGQFDVWHLIKKPAP